MSNDLDSTYQAFVDKGQIHGAILCARDSSGEFHYTRTFGSRTLLSGEQKPQQLSDVLFLASSTKLLTTIAALQCVEAGLLSLTDDVSSIAPELKGKRVLTGDTKDGAPVTEEQKYPITLELLLTHSSGALYPFMPEIQKYAEATGEKYDAQPTVEGQGASPLAFQPGKGWQYGLSIDWAGKLVERATGMKLGDYFKSRIFGPFGVSDLAFFPERESLRGRMVDYNPSDPNGDGIAVMGGAAAFQDRKETDHFGGHGLYTTAENYLKVLGSILADDGKLLKPETAAWMFQPHLTPEALASMKSWMQDSPVALLVSMGVPLEVKRNWGLGGILIQEDLDGWFGEGTILWGGGMSSTWFMDRKNGLCGFGAPQLKLPMHVPDVEGAKQAFRRGIYDVYREWKGAEA